MGSLSRQFVTFCLVLVLAERALAVGWDRDDFIISAGLNFPDRIGIFDHDFTFKGYLDTNFFGVQGMDFDAQGRLIATSILTPEVRIYSPNGVRVGGFTQSSSPMLVESSDLKVAPDGNYVLGTLSNGARVFTPLGTFVRQYGDGNSAGVALVPSRRLWAGGTGTTVRIFDTESGVEVGTFTADQQVNSGIMQYSPATNTVLMIDPDRDAGGVFERDVNGVLLRQFHVPAAQVGTRSATRGPDGDIFGTTSDLNLDVVRWFADGGVAGTFNVYPVDVHQVRIIWAGLVPEPGGSVVAVAGGCLFLLCRRRRPKTNDQRDFSGTPTNRHAPSWHGGNNVIRSASQDSAGGIKGTLLFLGLPCH